MKYTLFLVIVLGTIGLAAPTWAEVTETEAKDLLIPETEAPEAFAFDADDLDQLSTQINHGISVDSENSGQPFRPLQNLDLPDELVIINSNGNFATGREIRLR